jgi:hypothetical protein
MIRTLALAAGAGALVLGAAAPAMAAAPTADPVPMAQCETNRTTAMDGAKSIFQADKKKAWDTFALSTESTKGSKKDAAQVRRQALKTAIKARKDAFTIARTDYTACMATATDKPADS